MSFCAAGTVFIAVCVGVLIGCSACGFLLCRLQRPSKITVVSFILAAFCLLIVRNNYHYHILFACYDQPFKYSVLVTSANVTGVVMLGVVFATVCLSVNSAFERSVSSAEVGAERAENQVSGSGEWE